MKKMCFVRRAISVMVAAVLACSTTAFAAGTPRESYESAHLSISGYGINYEMWSTLYQDSRNTWRGSSWVNNTANKELPEGYMGVATGLYRPNGGAAYVKKAMTWNRYPSAFHFQETPSTGAEDVGIICKGEISVYNGSDYNTESAPSTVVRYPSKSAISASDYIASVRDELALTLDENGKYPVTATGKTYGSELLYDVVGEKPDLIYAEGIDGTLGYILSSDLEPNVNNPEEAVAYTEKQKSNQDGYYTIPLYDLNENVIGLFKVLIEDNEVSEEAQHTVYRLEENAKLVEIVGASEYSVNSKGETYGSSLLTSVVGVKPDLEAAIGTEGQNGYIRERDTIWGKWKDSIRTPQDALRYMEYLDTQPSEYLIPLYDFEGNVIGDFEMCRGDI